MKMLVLTDASIIPISNQLIDLMLKWSNFVHVWDIIIFLCANLESFRQCQSVWRQFIFSEALLGRLTALIRVLTSVVFIWTMGENTAKFFRTTTNAVFLSLIITAIVRHISTFASIYFYRVFISVLFLFIMAKRVLTGKNVIFLHFIQLMFVAGNLYYGKGFV